jgi:hypothetical protein
VSDVGVPFVVGLVVGATATVVGTGAVVSVTVVGGAVSHDGLFGT